MRKTFKYRCYPNVGTQKRARQLMIEYKRIWNNALAERWRNYDAICVAKQQGETPPKRVSAYDQYHHIAKSQHPELARYHSQALDPILSMLQHDFRSFYQLVKKDPTARPPGQMRFCGWFTYRQKGWRLKERATAAQTDRRVAGRKRTVDLYLPKLGPGGSPGRFPLRYEREIEGRIKQVTIVEESSGRWFACFSCELPDAPPARKKTGVIEIDFGFSKGVFLRDSEGGIWAHPEFYFAEIDELRRLQRAKERTQIRSKECPRAKGRRRARRRIARWHARVRDRRDAFLWSLARFYAENYGTIAVPQWPLKEKIHYAIDHKEARRLCDAAYGKFLDMLKWECSKFGSEFSVRQGDWYELERERLARIERYERTRRFVAQASRAIRQDRRAQFRGLAAEGRGLLDNYEGDTDAKTG